MMNLNTKELKGFRDSLGMWHLSVFEIADMAFQSNIRIKNANIIITSNKAMLDAIDNGKKVIKSKSELETEITEQENVIKRETDALNVYKKEREDGLKKGTDLMTADLMKAIKEYLDNIYDNSKETALLEELVKWFKANGAKDADIDGVKPYIRALGQKKNGTRAIIKTKKHNGVGSEKSLTEIFLGAICDEPNMAKVLPTHKFISIIEKKAKNK